jgi:hypothetical protein
MEYVILMFYLTTANRTAPLHLATCLHAGFFLTYFFDPEDRGDIFLRNVG